MELQVFDVQPDSDFVKTKKGKSFYHFELSCREEYNNNNFIKIYVSSFDDEGKKLFSDGAVPRTFTLIENHVGNKGVIVARYARAGAIKTGNVGE